MLKKHFSSLVVFITAISSLQAQSVGTSHFTQGFTFSTEAGTPSGFQGFAVYANSFPIPGAIMIIAPVPFEVSLYGAGPYSDHILVDVNQNDGHSYYVDATNIYIRYNPSTATGTPDQNAITVGYGGNTTASALASGTATTATSVKENQEFQTVVLSPNPSSDGIFQLDNSQSIDFTSIQVKNSNGEEIFSASLSESTVDLSTLKSGLYYVILTSSKGNLCRKVVIN